MEDNQQPNPLDYELTDDQKKIILLLWDSRPDNPPSVRELALAAFDVEKDPRSIEGKAIKKFLANFKIEPSKYKPNIPPPLVLSDEQKEYIKNNLENNSSIEIARDIFEKPSLSNLSKEAKLVKDYALSLKAETTTTNLDDFDTQEYFPPRSLGRAATKIKQYKIVTELSEDKIKNDSKIKEKLYAIIKACQMFRFGVIINNFLEKRDKSLFEASYIKYIWDMPDLSEGELDLTCNHCCDIVNYSKMQAELEYLQSLRDKCADDSDGKRLSMSIVESIANIRKEMDENHKRQSAAIKSLQGQRNERIESLAKKSESILQLVEDWKTEEGRQRMLKFADERNKAVKDELKRLDSLDSYLAEIYGIPQFSES